MIAIKDFKMPENCLKCPMQFGGWCYVSPPEVDERVAPTVDEAWEQGKPDWCPLIDVPEMNVGNSSEIPNSSPDCISRQAAINALGEEPMVWIGSDYELAQKNQWNLDKLAIETVPSAQPERKSVIYYGDGYADGAIVYDEAECPSCGRVYDQEDFHVWGAPFCPHCGQALDWEGEKDEGN